MLHWVPAWGDFAGDDDLLRKRFARERSACGLRVRLPRTFATSDGDFSCDEAGRCRRCWRAWSAASAGAAR